MKASWILAGALACVTAAPVTASSATVPGDQEPKRTVLLDQGWSQDQRDLFHYTSQGASFMPAAWLAALEDAGPQGGLLMAPENVRRYGLLAADNTSAMNPYGFPIGIAIDTETKDGIPQAGPTCALCHTGQIDYDGRSIHIEGGQANIDIQAFGAALVKAVVATATDPARHARFTDRAVRLGYPRDRIEVDFDAMYHRMLKKQQFLPDPALNTPAGPARQDAVNSIINGLFSADIGVPSNARPLDSPVNPPYLWDMWLFDRTQYNASARQPMGRDIVEVIGQPSIVRFLDSDGNLFPERERWRTTIRPRNLYAIRGELDTLKPPPWPEGVLGKIDRAKAEQGQQLFTQNCAACHGVKLIKGTSNPEEWHVPVVRLDKIGTDPTLALNFSGNTYDGTKLGLSTHTSIAEGTFAVVPPFKRQAYLDAGIPQSEWARYDGFGRKDEMEGTPCGYRARPLIGVWATAPFLHNGSVPTLYDLLSETRPASFTFGSAEYNPRNLGFSQKAGIGTMVLDTKLKGNSNAGHWFTDDASRPGRTGRALTDPERYAIIEYLKAATPADYPTVQIDPPGPAPCLNDPGWAKNWPTMPSN